MRMSFPKTHRVMRLMACNGLPRRLALLACALSLPLTAARAQSVLDESDAIFGTKLEAASTGAPGPRIGTLDLRRVMLFHPLMQYLTSSYGNSPVMYFLPPGSGDLTKMFDERRAKRLAQVRQELEGLYSKRAGLTRDLAGLQGELNRAVKAAATDAAARKQAEERFWQRKKELGSRMAGYDDRVVALEHEIKDPLQLLENTRQAILLRVQRETAEAVAAVAGQLKLSLVLNAFSPGEMPQASRTVQPPQEPGPFPGANEYNEFLSGPPSTDKTEPAVAARRLLATWEARKPRIEGIFGRAAAQSVLYGGRDVTWEVLRELLTRYKVPAVRVSALKAHFETVAER